MQETKVRSLGLEDPLEAEMATHSSIPAWRIPIDRGAWQATIHRVTKSQTQLSTQHTRKLHSGTNQRRGATSLSLGDIFLTKF